MSILKYNRMRIKYLDPKADLTFKRVFGEHPDIVISFLNAMLPLADDELIESVEYLPTELVPRNSLRKNTIVDVRCKDARGRQFLVEMQMIWSEAFRQRVLFNASKAYVNQLGEHENYEILQPVYSLNLINDIFETEWGEEYYHHYKVVNVLHSDRVIEGLQFVFVELPKFKAQTYTDKKMQALWIRFLNEIGEKTREVSPDLLNEPTIRKAVGIIEESSYDDSQIYAYDKFWDAIRVERTLVSSALREGREEGIKAGREEGIKAGREEEIKAGREEGREEGKMETARNLKQMQVPIDTIMQATGLTREQIENI